MTDLAAVVQTSRPRGVPQWTLGDRLRKAREEAGLEQEELTALLVAAGIKAKRASVSAWERDVSQPRDVLRVVNKWAEITGVPVWWLLDIESASRCNLTTPRERHLKVVPNLSKAR